MFITKKELNKRIQEAVEKDRKRMEEEEYIRKRFADLEREFEYTRQRTSDMVFNLECKLEQHINGGTHENGTADIPKSY